MFHLSSMSNNKEGAQEIWAAPTQNSRIRHYILCSCFLWICWVHSIYNKDTSQNTLSACERSRNALSVFRRDLLPSLVNLVQYYYSIFRECNGRLEFFFGGFRTTLVLLSQYPILLLRFTNQK
jgi:hypothetical protein